MSGSKSFRALKLWAGVVVLLLVVAGATPAQAAHKQKRCFQEGSGGITVRTCSTVNEHDLNRSRQGMAHAQVMESFGTAKIKVDWVRLFRRRSVDFPWKLIRETAYNSTYNLGTSRLYFVTPWDATCTSHSRDWQSRIKFHIKHRNGVNGLKTILKSGVHVSNLC